jgi:hypothetical protein
MNEFGEPNMGNPSVRFDEGRARVGHWPCASQSDLPAYSTTLPPPSPAEASISISPISPLSPISPNSGFSCGEREDAT